jgi:MYXO-CTERM domain-containing protein
MEVPKRLPQATAAGMEPADITAAYKIPASAAANGKIVAIIDAPDSNAYTDLVGYRSTFGITALPQCTGLPTGTTPCFAQVAEDGSASTGADSGGDDVETSLDMDMISAACPDCSILLVEINSNYCEADIVQGVETAIKLGASAVSISLGGPEMTDPHALSLDAGPLPEDAGGLPCGMEIPWSVDIPGPFSTPGHLVFAASGDFGYDQQNEVFTATVGADSPSWPSSSPYVIAVGGTSVYKTGTTTPTYGEGVWDDGYFGLDEGTSATSKYQDITTSGCSSEFTMPPWQSTVLDGTGCTKRATADVSAAATFFNNGTESAISVYITEGTQSGVGGVEGTSAASPLVAAIYTRLGLTTEASNDLSWTYTNESAFNDVGSAGYPIPTGAKSSDAPSGATCGKLCTAGTGWDGPTGVGSPNGTALAALTVSTSGPVAYPDAGVTDPWDGGGLTFGTSSSSSSSSGGSSSGASSGGEDASASSSSGSSSGTSSGTGTSSGASSGSSQEDGGSGNGATSGGGKSSGGCSVVAAGSEKSNAGILGVALGLAALGARRRRRA